MLALLVPTAGALATAAGGGAPRALVALFHKVPQQADHGEPEVRVGLAWGQKEVRVRGPHGLVATWDDAEGTHRRVLPQGSALWVTLKQGHGAAARWLLPLSDGQPVAAGAQADGATLQLERRLEGLHVAVDWQQSGAVWPLFAQGQDRRQQRLVARAPSLFAAEALRRRLGEDLPQVQLPEQALTGLPAGELQLTVARPGEQVRAWGTARSIITLEPDTPALGSAACAPPGEGLIEVLGVPVGMGYPWAGQQDRSYRGTVMVLVGADGLLTVVNSLPLETYLRGVVPAEMPPTAPAAALQAQAIAARSNVVYEMGHRHRDAPFDFCAEQHCQVYGGHRAEDARTDRAIADSEGQVLMAGGQVVHALFSADCGGRSENNDVPWPQRPEPTLRSAADCGHGPAASSWQRAEALTAYLRAVRGCRGGPGAQATQEAHRPWHKAVSRRQLAALWAPHQGRLGPLVDVLPGPRGPGGRLLQLTLKGTGGDHTIHRELPIRQALGGLPSAAFVITHQRLAGLPAAQEGASAAAAPGASDGQDAWALQLWGTGWGHGVGLCQRGAMGRARAGSTAAQILAHYYAASTVQTLYHREVQPP